MSTQLNLEDMRIMACDNELVKYPFNASIVGGYAWEEKRGHTNTYQKELALEDGRRVMFSVSFDSDSLTTKYVDCQEL